MSAPAVFPKVFSPEISGILKKRFEVETLKREIKAKQGESYELMQYLQQEKLAILTKLEEAFPSRSRKEVIREISDEDSEVRNKYLELCDSEAKRGISLKLQEVSLITLYVTTFQQGLQVISAGVVGMSLYYARTEKLLAVANGIFVISMAIIYKFTSEVNVLFQELGRIKVENTSEEIKKKICDVYQRTISSSLFLAKFIRKEGLSDHFERFEEQAEAIPALMIQGELYQHPYRKSMQPSEMKATFAKEHSVLNAAKKGVALWGGLGITLTGLAFYRRAYLMIGAALLHTAAAFSLNRTIGSSISIAAELKSVEDDQFNALYRERMFNGVNVDEKRIQAQVLHLNAMLKLIPS